jgi:acyl-homoserine-lactone acylase
LNFRPGPGKIREAVGGDSYVAVVEFSDPVRAAALLAYGNASQPGSPHVGDQLELFAKKELRPVWRSREEIEAHLAEREVFRNEKGKPSP